MIWKIQLFLFALSLRSLGILHSLGLSQALLELVHAASGVHKLLLAGVKRMRIGADTHQIKGIFIAVLPFSRFSRLHTRVGEKRIACRSVTKDNWAIILIMNVFSHEMGGENTSRSSFYKREMPLFFGRLSCQLPITFALGNDVAGAFAAKNPA